MKKRRAVTLRCLPGGYDFSDKIVLSSDGPR
jgi:hypothetical protein